jgi:hypothetical protein
VSASTPKPDAVLSRATTLLWCLAVADVEDFKEHRSGILEELRKLELSCADPAGIDLYAMVAASLEKSSQSKDDSH